MVFTAFAYIGQFNSRPRNQNELEMEKGMLSVRSLSIGAWYVMFKM